MEMDKCFEKDSYYEDLGQSVNCSQFYGDNCDQQEMVVLLMIGIVQCLDNVNEKASGTSNYNSFEPQTVLDETTQTTTYRCNQDSDYKFLFEKTMSGTYTRERKCFDDNQICSYKSEPGYTNNITDSVRNENCFLMEADKNHFNISTPSNHANTLTDNFYYTHRNLRDPARLKHFACSEIQRLYNHSKSLLPVILRDSVDTDNEQKVTASKIIDYRKLYW